MNKLKLFTIEFIICTIAYILFNNYDFVDTLVFCIFFLSAINYVFASESLPKAGKFMKSPAVHYYKKVRINNYGYEMGALLCFISLVYMLLTLTFQIRAGVATLLLWIFMLISTYLLTKLSMANTNIEIISDYLINNLKTREIDNTKLEKITAALLKLNMKDLVTKKQNIEFLIAEFNISQQQSLEIVNMFFDYIMSFGTDLTSDEIDELNKI